MRAILQKTLPYDLRLKRALPGIQPLQRSDWLQIDEAYDQQIAERERLLSVARGVVVQLSETARPAAEELLDQTCSSIRCDFSGRIGVVSLLYAIAGVCLLKVILFAALSNFCEMAP